MPPDWVIWYDDGATFSSNDGSPFDAPRLGVQVITQRDERVGWVWISGHDYFYLDPKRGGWRSSDTIFDYLLRARTPLVLFGRNMADHEWHALFARVKASLGDKQGWLVSEDRRNDHP